MGSFVTGYREFDIPNLSLTLGTTDEIVHNHY